MPEPQRLACLLVGCGALLVASEARAWGDEGHRVVGEIAWRYASPAARRVLSESLTEPGYQSLAEAATWPDAYARRFHEYDPMKPFHYVNVAVSASSYQRERDCPSGCVVTALSQFVSLLGSQDPPLAPSERRYCIYWIAHLVGDLHQPLHVAHPDGRGGTATLVKFFDDSVERNLHWVWDVGLLERRGPPKASVSGDASALADELLRDLQPAQARAWQRTTAPEALASESLGVARRYAFGARGERVDEAYVSARWPVVAEQLSKAGVRLAAILNRALAPETQQKAQKLEP